MCDNDDPILNDIESPEGLFENRICPRLVTMQVQTNRAAFCFAMGQMIQIHVSRCHGLSVYPV